MVIETHWLKECYYDAPSRSGVLVGPELQKTGKKNAKTAFRRVAQSETEDAVELEIGALAALTQAVLRDLTGAAPGSRSEL